MSDETLCANRPCIVGQKGRTLLYIKLHRLFYGQIDKDNAGTWRKVRVFISGSRRVLPAPEKVPALMADFVKWMAANEGRLTVIE